MWAEYWPIFVACIVGYVFMIAFWIGFFWKLWDGRWGVGDNFGDEVPVTIVSILWIVLVPCIGMWHLGRYIIGKVFNN